MAPATPEYAQPVTVLPGAVWKACTTLFCVSRRICGRDTQSPTEAMVDWLKDPVAGLKTSSSNWGRVLSVEVSFRLVLTAANTRPLVSAWRVLMFRWSSAWPLPLMASWKRHDDVAVGLVPSVRMAQCTLSVSWSLHITPILLLPNATIAEMSSAAAVGLAT